MQRGAAKILKLSLAIVVCVLAVSVSAARSSAEESRLTIPEARLFAAQLLNDGHPWGARAVALGILQSDPNDFAGLIITARAELAMQAYDRAEDAGKRAWRAADSENDRFTAAFTVAQAQLGAEKFTQAQMWLRRSAQVAPKDNMRNVAVRTFQEARRANPWHTRIGLRFSPSSNINNGPTSNQLDINGLVFINPAARPLSGYEMALDFSTERRVELNESTRLRFGFNLDERQYVLTDSANRKVPSANGDDFDFRAVELTFGLDRLHRRGQAKMRYDLTLGRNWSGGDVLSDYARFELGRDTVLSPKTGIGFELAYEVRDRHDSTSRSSDIWEVSTRLSHRFDNGASGGVLLTLSDTDSESSAIEHQSVQIVSYYSPGETVAGVIPVISLSFQARNFDRPFLGAVREDRETTLNASFLFSDLDYFGFAPTVGFSASRNKSNISLYDSEEFGLNLGLKSVF